VIRNKFIPWNDDMNLVRSLDGIHIPTSAYIAGQVSPWKITKTNLINIVQSRRYQEKYVGNV